MMSWKKVGQWLAIALIASVVRADDLPLSAYPDFNGYKVHPTRILARYDVKDGETLTTSRMVAEAVANKTGMHIVYDYDLVPGLVLLDEIPSGVSIATIGKEARAAALKRRVFALNTSGRFLYAHPDSVKYAVKAPTDQRFTDGTLWGLQNSGQAGGLPGADINAVAAWDITTGDHSVVIADIDTGLRYTHSDIQANVWVNKGEIPNNGIDDDGNGVIDDVYGFNGVSGSGDPFDDATPGHGTHTGGTIAAVANNGFPHVGVSWNVQLMACKFLTAQGFGSTADAIKCLNYAVRMGAKVSNNSWGGGGGDPIGEQALVDAITAAGAAGHLFIAAAGNNGANNDFTFFSPASLALDNMVVVAAIDRKDLLANFSNFGIKTVNVGAPGVEIFSTLNGSDSDYGFLDGTSMATPHVTGVAALVLAAHPKADLAEVKARLINSTVSTPALQGAVSTGGRINAYDAVIGTRTGTVQLTITPPDKTQILVNSTNSIFVRVTDILSITNATVSAVYNGPGATNVTIGFTNNGAGPDLVAADDIYSAYFTPTNIGSYTFIFKASATNEMPGAVTNTYIVRGRPANDSFASPSKIPSGGGTITDNNGLASLEVGEPLEGGVPTADASLWYAYSPNVDNNALVSSIGSTFPNIVAVYTGSALQNLVSVASGVGTDLKPDVQFNFPAKAGTTYWIAVASINSTNRGSIRLSVVPNGVPDVVAPFVSISGLTDGTIVTSGSLKISGTAVDPQPSPTGVSQVLVGLNGGVASGAAGTTNWSTTLTLAPGANKISVAAVDLAGNLSSPISVTVLFRPVPQVNDLFAFPTPLTGMSGTVAGANVGATKEPGEPAHGGNQGGHSVWWSFKSGTPGVLHVSTTNSSFDTLLGAYTGDFVYNLTTIGENDDAFPGSGWSKLDVPVPANTPVYLAVDGFAGASGSISLTYKFTTTPLLSVTVATPTNGAVVPGSGLVASNGFVQLTAIPDAHYVFAGWSGSLISSDNPLQILVVSNINLTANFAAQPLDDGFESGNLSALPWASGGDAPWFVETNTVSLGKYAVQAGKIGDNQSSSLEVSVNSSGGLISFDYKVSSEAGFDLLSFYVDGNLVQSWSGELDWSTYTYLVSSGVHDFKWVYAKDPSGSVGQDTAWLDNIELNTRPAVTSASTAKISILPPYAGVSATALRLQVTGQVGQSYVTQTSTNLVDWVNSATNLNSLGTFLLQESTFSPARQFFRVIPAP
jgi:subtilisin family serine protease